MLAQVFETFRRGLESAEAPPDGVLVRHRVREHLASSWKPVRELVVGSVARNTNLRPTRAVDELFVLGPVHQPYLTGDPAKVLADIEGRLGVVYPMAKTKKLTHGLGLTFGDVTAVLIPALPKHGGGVFIPDTELRRWLPTDPEGHARFTADHDRAARGFGLPAVRALKAWARAQKLPVRSFHLEVMALRALAASPPEGFMAACVAALDGVAAQVTQRCAAPAPVGDDVDMYLALTPDRRAKIARAALDAADALRDAIAHDAAGNLEPAVVSARAVFAQPFPGA